MRSRLRAYERRLARLAGILRAWSGETERAAKRQEGRKLIAMMARAGLAAAGIDPGTAVTLRDLDAPEPARPQVHPLRRAAQRSQQTLLDFLRETTARYHHGRPPDLAQASPMQIVGYYCFGDGTAREAPA